MARLSGALFLILKAALEETKKINQEWISRPSAPESKCRMAYRARILELFGPLLHAVTWKLLVALTRDLTLLLHLSGLVFCPSQSG